MQDETQNYLLKHSMKLIQFERFIFCSVFFFIPQSRILRKKRQFSFGNFRTVIRSQKSGAKMA